MVLVPSANHSAADPDWWLLSFAAKLLTNRAKLFVIRVSY